MKIWLISQNKNTGFDTYDSAVVAAESEYEAQRISPTHFYEVGPYDEWYFLYSDGEKKSEGRCPDYFGWSAVDDVEVTYLGEAKPETDKGLILASYNAG